MTEKPLTPQQERFCEEYLVDLCGRKAAIRASYAEKAAEAQASRMLKDPRIQRRIKELMAKRSKRVELDQDQVLKELARIGFSDVRRLFDEKGNIKDPSKWPKSLARAIASIEVDELYDYVDGRRVHIGQTKKVKFWPKVSALELLGKHLGMFSKTTVDFGTETLEALVAGSRRKEGEWGK